MSTVPESADLRWRKSARSAGDGACIEIAESAHGVAVRDSKHPDGLVLWLDAGTWRQFIASIRAGDFDPPSQ
jgi:hypothetical protein